MNVSESQTARACSRTSGEKNCELLRPEIESGRDDGQHARSMNRFRRQIRRVRNQKTDGDLDWSIVNPMFKPFHDPCQDQAASKAREGEIDKAQQAGPDGRVLTVDHHRDGEFREPAVRWHR